MSITLLPPQTDDEAEPDAPIDSPVDATADAPVEAPAGAPGLPATVGGHFFRFVYTDWAWLAPVLLLQAGLAVRVNGPVATDEATYIVAGHQLIANLLHGAHAQDYGSYFSGVPSLYPVLAASIDHVLGLTGVRLLSLVCMLVTNVCLFAITRRLFGSRTATFASFVFAVSSGATFLAWYATFDALSLMLLALATLLAFRVLDRSGLWPVAAIGPVLASAVAIKYVAIIYVPAILGVLAWNSLLRYTWPAALVRCAVAASTTVGCGLFAYLVTSPSDVNGFLATSSSGRRVLEPESRLDLLGLSWSFVGPSLLLALAGLVVLLTQRRARINALLLFSTGLIPVISQVILGESTSLHKHTAFGLFFAAPLAGYAITRALALGRSRLTGRNPPTDHAHRLHTRIGSLRRSVVPVAVVAWVVYLLGTGMSSVETMRYGWAESGQVEAAMSPYVTSNGNYLADNASIPSYAFRYRTSPGQWTAPWFFGRTVDHQQLTGDPALLSAIQHDFFDVIVYRPQTFTPAQKTLLLPAIAEHYRLVSQLAYSRQQSWYVWVPVR